MRKTNLKLADGGRGAAAARTKVPVAAPTLAERAEEIAAQDLAPASREAYARDWSHFLAWCHEHGHPALPATPDTVRLYLTDHAETYKPATLGRRLVAVCRAHKEAGYEPPTRAEAVRRQLRAIRRSVGAAQERKTPLLPDQLRGISETLPRDTLQGKRDRALLLLGFAGAFRRSELVALDARDVRAAPEGLLVTIRRSKTDQEGRGRVIGIPRGANAETCPVRALAAWREAAGITAAAAGPLFRAVDRHGNVSAERLTGKSVAKIVKRCVAQIGLETDPYAGHSLRAGLVTAAAKAKVPEHKIMQQTGHKSRATLERYIRDAQVFEGNAAAATGL